MGIRFPTNVLPLLIFSAITVLTGCAAHVGVQPTTGATVDRANFEVVDSVEGHAQNIRYFGFGSPGTLLQRARLDAVNEAGLYGSNRAIINWTSDYEYTFYGLALKEEVTLSGEVVRYRK